MKQIIFLLVSPLVLVMLFSSFTGTGLNGSMTKDNYEIELVKRSGGTRSATITEVFATEVFAFANSDGSVTVEIINYSGSVWVCVEGSEGVQQQVVQVSESGLITLDISALPSGSYYLRITLDNGQYEGFIEK